MALDRKMRRRIFWSLVGLFVLAGFLLACYSFGYRVDWKNKKITQIGGINLKTFPKASSVDINGHAPKKSANFLTGNIFIQNLKPGIYDLSVYKEGYFSWDKKAEVKPKFVSDFSKIILLPKVPFSRSAYQIASGEKVLGGRIFGDNMILEFEEKSGSGLWRVLKIISSEKTKEVFRKKISANYPSLLDSSAVEFENNELNRILIAFSGSGQKNFYLWNVNRPDYLDNLTAKISAIFGSVPNKVIFHPFESEKYLFSSAGKIYIFDAEEKTFAVLAGEKVFDFSAFGGKLFWAEKDGRVYSYSLILKTITLMSSPDYLDFKTSGFGVSSDGLKTWVGSDAADELWVDFGGSTVKLTSSDSWAVFSPDSQKIIFSGKNKFLSVYFFEDILELPDKKAGDETHFPFSGEKNLVWYKDNFHFFSGTESAVFSELDDRGKINHFSIKPENQKFLDFSEEGSALVLSAKEILIFNYFSPIK